jgi:hypothetical protein
MPKAIKPRSKWRAGGWVPELKLSKAQATALYEAAGLDPHVPEDKRHINSIIEAVTHAASMYQAERRTEKGAPRPVHQRVALERVQSSIDALLTAINDLDDASMDRLTEPRRSRTGAWFTGLEPHRMTEQLRLWDNVTTLALREIEDKESRGRVKLVPRRRLLRALTDVFTEHSNGDGHLPDFLAVGCKVAGASLTDGEAKRQAAELLPRNTP